METVQKRDININNLEANLDNTEVRDQLYHQLKGDQ